MPHSLAQSNIWRNRAQELLVETLLEAIYLVPAVSLVFMSLVPAQALAFVEMVETSQKPLVFIRDPRLSDTAIVGIEAFPRARTVAGLLNDRTSRIPDATGVLTAGMAVRVLATAYSSTPDQTDASPFITASGAHVNRGTLAANFLPFGTRVRINTTEYTVQDRMNARYNGKYIIDLWFPTREEAVQFGVRVVEMEIVALP